MCRLTVASCLFVLTSPVVLVRAASDELMRTVVTREPIVANSPDRGSEAFRGPETLTFTVPPCPDGPAVLTLQYSDRGRTNFMAMVRDGSVCFDTHLCCTNRYLYVSLKLPGQAWDEKTVIRRAEAEFHETAAEALRVELQTGNALHVVRREKSERARVCLRNPTSERRRWHGRLRGRDVFGRMFRMHYDETIPPKGMAFLPLPDPLPAKGMWFVDMGIEAEDGSRTVRQLRVADIDTHEVTPYVAKPAYRFGIHWSANGAPAYYRTNTLDAIVAMGAKLVRVDYVANLFTVRAKENTWDWGKADETLSVFERNGLASMVILGGTPHWWAVDAERKKGVDDFQWCLPPRKGIYREFAQKVAERYGRRIDYYENGNELDLVTEKALTVDETLDIQREVYEGVHAGCPTACVTTCGWAGAAPSGALAKRGFYGSRRMDAVASHPEWFDAWAWHCHGDMGWYSYGLPGEFLPFYEKRGLNGKPWICGETGMTTYPGLEIETAKTVWAKMLFTLAWGASDHVWYNLRATGWFDGHEPGYGLMTADLYPRAGYAAFAALTTVFQGLAPDGRIYSRGNRHVFRYSGVSAAVRGKVIAGWDFTLKKPILLRIKTNAIRATLSDYMGNRTDIDIRDGATAFPLSANPQALLLEGATVAELVEKSELGQGLAERTITVSANTDGKPTFVLSKERDVRDYNYANPAVAHRLWQGPQDLSAEISLCRLGDDLGMTIRVTDDVDAEGDGIDVLLEIPGREQVRFDVAKTDGVSVNRSREGSVTLYEIRIEGNKFGFDAGILAMGIGFAVYVREDDGEGPDGVLQLIRESDEPRRIRFAK